MSIIPSLSWLITCNVAQTVQCPAPKTCTYIWMAQLSHSGEEGQFLLTAFKWQISPELKRVSKLSYTTVARNVVLQICISVEWVLWVIVMYGVSPIEGFFHTEFIIYFSKLLVNLFRLRHQAAVVINDVSTQSFGVKRQVGWYLARLRHGSTSLSWNDLRLVRNFQQQPKWWFDDQRKRRRNERYSFWKFLEGKSSL